MALSETRSLFSGVTALHHRFAEIYTYDARQSAAAGVLGLKPLADGR